MDTSRLASLLCGQRLRGPVTYLEVTGSTNDDLRQAALDGAPEGTVIVAGQQTQGRGRQGRRWHSAPGHSLLFSVLLRPPLPPGKWASLSCLAGAATALACRAATGQAVGLKWPNDIVFEGRKLAGILVETRLPEFAVIGVGLNLSGLAQSLPAEIARRAAALSDLRATAGAPELALAPEPLLAAVLNLMDEHYDRLLGGETQSLRQEQLRLETTLGHQVVVDAGGETVEGLAADLTEAGELLIVSGATRRLVGSGEVVKVLSVDGG